MLKAKDKPLILITNDDGINSPGLKALAEAINPICNLLIAAPMEQQTGMGRGFLKGDEVGIIEKKNIQLNDQIVEAYAVNSSPAQAVAHAVLELTDKKPDYCISGVNYGENLGLAFTCSGTLGAAFEADSLGIPAVAFSRAFPFNKQKSNNFSSLDWEAEKYHIRNIIKNITANGFPQDVRILNVNFPIDIDQETKVRITRQAYMNYAQYMKPEDRNFSKGHSLKWKLNPEIEKLKKDTDIYAVHFDKIISITPLNSRMSVDTDNYYQKWS
ncbi:5'-nucleotidase /3'-nucleotidase /exopolyphosphatase [Halanaerobium saccharolyticum]|uniref:5'-nucleotidase n=1 Tax=Halanaerobium saccharolyticum TaxID=43595 RepID=A0A4R6LLW5_9FIRM|nr:5'/3'-nucleotidase SurE [Halanaerobium saccharolyticum]TDO84355.1 5'-nucleotidase /3'-nucleotidase /exopolyphosphatase [Halanaerobium saccharolyticum]